jgi:hypothetical protein
MTLHMHSINCHCRACPGNPESPMVPHLPGAVIMDARNKCGHDNLGEGIE